MKTYAELTAEWKEKTEGIDLLAELQRHGLKLKPSTSGPADISGDEGIVSTGSIDGYLETKDGALHLCPSTGPSVRLKVSERHSSVIANCSGKIIHAEGEKHYVVGSPHPFLMEVESLSIVPPGDHLISMRGALSGVSAPYNADDWD